ncbi:MAG: MFS transporter [Akkermansiaceae bacterium]|nr:MFS transporter [Akkermansiaceae bacterium]MCF7730705.1 MFS transporter [Akkermansiaceae bacterium]
MPSPLPIPGKEAFEEQRRTFSLELVRALPQGVVETSVSTFALFVAIRIFDMPPWMKAVIVGSGSMGLLLSLFTVQIVRRLGCSVNAMAGAIWLISAAGFGVAASSENHAGCYFGGICSAGMALALAAPLMSQIYRKHYPDTLRGRLFSFSALVRAAVAGLMGWAAGLWISARGGAFSPLFWTYALCCLAMAGCVFGMAPVVLRRSVKLEWFDAFRHVANDRPFRKLLIVWMILGLGNLLGWALFVEFISNPRYGFDFDAQRVGMITSTVPMLVFIVCVIPWGMVFDRLPFYRVRALVNLFFLAGILCYYSSGSLLGLCVGIGLHGIARSGGNVLWSLWVTKFAEGDRVVEYMSVHSFLTGLRGVLAPLIAFTAAEYLGPLWVAWASTILIVVSTLMILPEIRAEGREKQAAVS